MSTNEKKTSEFIEQIEDKADENSTKLIFSNDVEIFQREILFEKAKNVQHQNEIEQKRNQIQCLQNQLEENVQQIDRLTFQCRLINENEKKQSLLFEKKIKSLEQQIQQFKEENFRLNEEKTSIFIDNSQLQQLGREKDEIIDDLTNKHRIQLNQEEIYQNNLKLLEEKCLELRKENSRRQIERTTQQSEESFDRIHLLNEENDHLSQSFHHNQQIIRILNENLRKLTKENHLKSTKIEHLEKSFEEQFQRKNDEILLLKDQCQKLNQQSNYFEEFYSKQIEQIKEQKENQMKNDFKDLKETLQSKTIDLNKVLEENVQLHQLLSEETELNLKNSSSSNFFEKQFEELNERHVQLQNRFNDLQIEHESLVLFNQKLDFEYKQTKSTLEDCRNKESKLKENLQQITFLLDQTRQCLTNRENELEQMNFFCENIQKDSTKYQNDLSQCQNELVQLNVDYRTSQDDLKEKLHQLKTISFRFHQLEDNFHLYEKEHRYSNEEFFQRDKDLKDLQLEFKHFIIHHQRIEKDFHNLKEEQSENKDFIDNLEEIHQVENEQLNQANDQIQLYKDKLIFLIDCLTTLIRETSNIGQQSIDQFVSIENQMKSFDDDFESLQQISEHFNLSTKNLHEIDLEHQSTLLQMSMLKSNLKNLSSSFQKYQLKFMEISEQHRQSEENLLRKLEQTQIELINEKEFHQHLKVNYDEISIDRNQCIIDLTEAKKKIEQLDSNILQLVEEKDQVQTRCANLETQLIELQWKKDFLNKTFEENYQSYQEKINEYQSSIELLKESHEISLKTLEEKHHQFNRTQTELETIKYQLIDAHSKLEKFDQINQEYHRHISLLERSIDEHKRVIRQREKEIDHSSTHPVKFDQRRSKKNADPLFHFN